MDVNDLSCFTDLGLALTRRGGRGLRLILALRDRGQDLVEQFGSRLRRIEYKLGLVLVVYSL